MSNRVGENLLTSQDVVESKALPEALENDIAALTGCVSEAAMTLLEASLDWKVMMYPHLRRRGLFGHVSCRIRRVRFPHFGSELLLW